MCEVPDSMSRIIDPDPPLAFIDGKNEKQAIDAGMMRDKSSDSVKSSHCPECGCPWYGNKNLLGDGARTCFDCKQDWWIDIKYDNHALLRELPPSRV